MLPSLWVHHEKAYICACSNQIFHRVAPKPLDAFVQCTYAQTVTPLVMMLLRDATPLVAAGHFCMTATPPIASAAAAAGLLKGFKDISLYIGLEEGRLKVYYLPLVNLISCC